MSHVYLITGATRGIGKALTVAYLSRPSTTVIAGVRDPSGSSALALQSLPTGPSSQLLLVKIDSTSPSDPASAITTIRAAGISHLDTVIANAGICEDFSRVEAVPLDVFSKHLDTNAYGPLYLIQAVFPLLMKSQNPKFVAVGSALGTIGGMELRAGFPNAAYGPSKAVLHWLVRKMHFENEGLVSFVMEPGWVQTDMGNGGARRFGMEEASTSIEDSIKGMVLIIDNATREKNGGHFVQFDGTDFPW